MEIKCQLNDENQSNRLVVEANYAKGGYSYFTYKEERRGIYCYVRPEKVEGNSRSFIVFANNGFKVLLSEEKRLNRKKVEQYNAAINALDQAKVLDLFVSGNSAELVALVKQAVGVQ